MSPWYWMPDRFRFYSAQPFQLCHNATASAHYMSHNDEQLIGIIPNNWGGEAIIFSGQTEDKILTPPPPIYVLLEPSQKYRSTDDRKHQI